MKKTDSILKIANRAYLDDWSGVRGVAIADATEEEKIKATREKRKIDSKNIKLTAAAKSITDFQDYNRLLANPDLRREHFEIIISRIVNHTAFANTWKVREADKKSFVEEHIITHHLIKYDDLIKIFKATIKGDGRKIYSSKHLNKAIIESPNVDEDMMLRMLTISQYDLKEIISKKDRLRSDVRELLITNTIKHHAHMPEQVRTIFQNLGLSAKHYKEQLIPLIAKKYHADNSIDIAHFADCFNFLLTIHAYGWKIDMEKEPFKKVISRIFYQMTYNFREGDGNIEKVIKYLKELENETELNSLFYEKTQDIRFLPKSTKDAFLF